MVLSIDDGVGSGADAALLTRFPQSEAGKHRRCIAIGQIASGSSSSDCGRRTIHELGRTSFFIDHYFRSRRSTGH